MLVKRPDIQSLDHFREVTKMVELGSSAKHAGQYVGKLPFMEAFL